MTAEAAAVRDTAGDPDPHVAGVVRMSVRHSAALTAVPAMLALVAAHVLGRGRGWAHEWVWAHYQYGFVTVLLGPLVAGVAAWEGARLARSRDLLGTADRTVGALWLAWLGVATWVLVAYGAGLALVVSLVKAAGTPGWPPAIALASSVPPVMLLLAETAVGLAVGWWVRHAVAAPAVAVGTFLLTLWLYVDGPGELVIVGGATSSLVNTQPRVSMVCWQTVWLATVVPAALAAAATLTGWPGRRGRWRLPAALGVSLVAAVPLLAQGEVYLVSTSDEQVCTGNRPTVCVAPGYAGQADDVRRVLTPYVSAMRLIGVDAPAVFRQNGPRGQVTAGTFDIGLLADPKGYGPSTFLAAYLSKSCPIDTSPALQEAFTGLEWWLTATVVGERPPDDNVPAVLRGPASPAQTAWLVAAVHTLSTCGR